jgi:hypothetical protein
MAVAEPSLIGRVIAAWPSFALIASDELLMRQVSPRRRARQVPAAVARGSKPARRRAIGWSARCPVA